MLNRKPIRIIFLILIGIFFYLLGYLRNYIFLYVNNEAAALWYHNSPISAPTFLGFTTGMGYATLFRLKWEFTFLFYFLFLFMSLAAIQVLFNKRMYLALCVAVYGVLMFVSLVVMISGYIIHPFAAHAYHISRSLIHICQSPFIPLLLFIVIYYHQHGTSLVLC